MPQFYSLRNRIISVLYKMWIKILKKRPQELKVVASGKGTMRLGE